MLYESPEISANLIIKHISVSFKDFEDLPTGSVSFKRGERREGSSQK